MVLSSWFLIKKLPLFIPGAVTLKLTFWVQDDNNKADMINNRIGFIVQMKYWV